MKGTGWIDPVMDSFLQQIAALCRSDPTGAKWVLVPNHALGHTLGERLALEGTSWVNLRFRTPLDLALETAAPFLVERDVDPVPEELGPTLMTRLLMELPPDTPIHFRGLAAQPQVGAALWSAIHELRMAGIPAAELPPAAFANSDKHAELQALMAAYELHLESNRHADSSLVYREAFAHVEACPIRPADTRLETPGVVWLPLQRQFIDLLPGVSMDPPAPDVPNLVGPRRLRRSTGAPGQDAAGAEPASAEGGAIDAAAAPDTATDRPGPASDDDLPDASALRFLMAPGRAPPLRHDGTLQMFHAGGREAEVEEVLRRIAAAGAPFDQVEIACASIGYAVLVWQKAQRYDWPVTVGSGIPALMTRPARALLGLGDWIESGYPASRLRQLLQSGDVTLNLDEGPSAGQAARLLARAEATWGRSTYSTSLARLATAERERAAGRAPADADEETTRRRLERADQADRLRRWIEQLFRLLPEQSEGKTIPLDALVNAVRVFISSFAARSGPLDAGAVAAITVAMNDLALLGPVSRPVPDALRLLRSMLDDLTVGSDRPRPGHIHVSTLARAGHAGRPRVFVVGLEEGRVLPTPVEDAVLLDAERSAIHPALATSTDRVAEALHAVVSRLVVLAPAVSPSRGSAVCLSYSCRDLRQYRQTFPSWLLLQVRRLDASGDVTFEQLVEELGEPRSVVPLEPEQAISDAGWWLSHLRRSGPAARPVVLWAFPGLAQGREAEARRASTAFTVYDGYVRDVGPVLDPRVSGTVMSATRLEGLAACPFRYFLERGLGLEEAEEVERLEDRWLDALTRGSELHDLYAAVMRRLREDPQATGTEEQRCGSFARHQDWLRRRATARLEELRGQMPPPSEAVFDREHHDLLYDLELFLRFELDQTDRRPIAFEVAFGLPGGGPAEATDDQAESLARAEPIQIRLGEQTVRLRGRIDRIDRLDPADEGRYEIVDYKTGGFFGSDYDGRFRGGRLLQHALYGLAASELLRAREGGATVTSGVYYFPSARAGGQRVRIPQPSGQQVAAVLRDLLDTVGAGAMIHAVDENNCRWCGFAAACGRNPVGRARGKLANRANAQLEPYRRLLTLA